MDVPTILAFILLVIGLLCVSACVIIYMHVTGVFVRIKMWIKLKKVNNKLDSAGKRLDNEEKKLNDAVNYLNASNLWDKFIK